MEHHWETIGNPCYLEGDGVEWFERCFRCNAERISRCNIRDIEDMYAADPPCPGVDVEGRFVAYMKLVIYHKEGSICGL